MTSSIIRDFVIDLYFKGKKDKSILLPRTTLLADCLLYKLCKSYSPPSPFHQFAAYRIATTINERAIVSTKQINA